MTSIADTAGQDTTRRDGIALALLQLVFTLGWTVYVIYLP